MRFLTNNYAYLTIFLTCSINQFLSTYTNILIIDFSCDSKVDNDYEDSSCDNEGGNDYEK